MVPALCRGMETKDSECCEAPKKLGLSFCIDEILKRPTESRDRVRPEREGGQDTRQAPASPPQERPQGECILVASYPLLDL